MLTSTERHSATSPTPPPRLLLQPSLHARTLLDGGWWPRSADPAAELPGLIVAIDGRQGPITQIMLGTAGWDASRPRRVRVDGPAGSRIVRLGWFETMPAGLLIATARAGRTDLLTVPPDTGETAARAAMHQAARVDTRAPRRPRPPRHNGHSGPPASQHRQQPGADRPRHHPAGHLGMGRRARERPTTGSGYLSRDLAGNHRDHPGTSPPNGQQARPYGAAARVLVSGERAGSAPGQRPPPAAVALAPPGSHR
jgi:hypothetical protein